MKRLVTTLLTLFVVQTGLIEITFAQSLQTTPVTIIDNLPKTFSSPLRTYGKTSSCQVDTVKYPYLKTSQFVVISLNNSTSGNIFAQWYDAQQPLTISGFEFFAWSNLGVAPNPVLYTQVTCRIYEASATDSMPTGSPLASVTMNIDTTFGTGLLATLRKEVVFSTPVIVSTPYVLTIESTSSTTVNVVTNSWTVNPPNGRSEWLSSVRIGTIWRRGYNVTVGSSIFNADFQFYPFVSYALSADFVPSTLCNKGLGNQISFNNTSSWVLFNKFYNTRAFYNIAYTSCQWTYGDTSGTWYALNGSHNYVHRAPYNVRLRDTIYGFTSGCADVKTIALEAAPPPTPARSNSPVCSGYTIKLSADTLPNATGYYWTGPNGFTSTLQHPTIANAAPIHQGTYNLIAILGNCTSSVSTVAISIQSTPQAVSNSPICEGQALSLSTSSIAGATYSWTGPNGFSSTLQSPGKTNMTLSDSGIYSVTISSAGCGTIGPYSTLVAVHVIPPAPTASNNGPLCVGDNLNLTSTGISGTYKWIGPNGFSSNVQNLSRPTVQASFAGIYSVSVSQNGCSSNATSTTVVINNNPVTPVAANNGPLCAGQTLSLTASLIAGASYTWSGPNGFSSTTQNPVRTNLTLIDAGNYSVIATLNGCNSTAATTTLVVGTSTPTPTAAYNGPLCPGQNLQLTASSIAGASYSWTGPNNFTSNSQNPSISNINSTHAGIYSVSATTSGCGTSTAGNITVVINTLPSAPVVSNNGPLCDGDSLMLTASSIPGAVYNWSGPLGFFSNLQNPVVQSMNAAKSGLYSVYVDVTGCGSSSTSTTQALVRRIPQTPSATYNSPVCEGDTLKLTASSFGTGPGRSFTWSGPNNFSSTFQTVSLGNATTDIAGIYSVRVMDSGCTSSTAAINVNIKTRPSAPLAANNSPVCEGNDVQLNTSGVAGATYKWTGPGGYLSTLQNPLLQGKFGVLSGTYFVSISVNGCNSMPSSTNVQLYPLPPEPLATNDGPVCSGNPVTLSANPIPNVTYSWTGPLGFTSAAQNPVLLNAKIGMSGVYSVSVIDSHCVSKPDTTHVFINNIPAEPVVSSFPAGPAFCAGDSVQLFATFVAGATYGWIGPAGFGSFIQNPVLRNMTPAFSGTYSVVLTKNNCPSIPSTISIMVNPLPNTGSIFGPDSVFTGEITDFQISGDSGSVFNWVAYNGAIQGAATGTLIQVKWGNNPGSGFVRVRETATTGCRGPLLQQNVILRKQPTSGLYQNTNSALNIQVFPVPADNYLMVDYPDGMFNANGAWKIYDILGKLLGDGTVKKEDALKIETGSLANGIYTLLLQTGNEVYPVKFEILR